MKKDAKGITLVALVITIIVLLILAGVTITALSGENGLLKRAAEAKEQTEVTQKAEQAKLDATEALIEMQTRGDICNKPNLKTGMIPVKWNGTTWVKADESNTNNDWYNYSQSVRQWANVVTVKENGTDKEKNANSKTRVEYMSAPVGTEIQMDDITTMFVWIPRYAYKIESTETTGYHNKNAGEFSIEWLLGATNQPVNNVEIVEYNKTTTEDYTKFPDGYVVHPAFTANTDMGGTGNEITGFWIGKFESSNYQMAEEYKNNIGITQTSSNRLTYGQGDSTNVTSWRAIDVTNIFNVCQNMTKASNIHGLSSEDTTTVMIQNSQWGAVAYLAQSNYGNKQTSEENSGIWNNPYN